MSDDVWVEPGERDLVRLERWLAKRSKHPGEGVHAQAMFTQAMKIVERYRNRFKPSD